MLSSFNAIETVISSICSSIESSIDVKVIVVFWEFAAIVATDPLDE